MFIILEKLARIIRKKYLLYENKVSGFVFDLRFSVETTKPLDRSALDIPSAKRIQSWSYEPCSIRRFKKIIRFLNLDLKTFTFIDIGSGKGRLLFLADQIGFKKIIGIEFSLLLHSEGEANVKKYKLRTNTTSSFELVNEDASNFNFPIEACLITMFNPFMSAVMEKFIYNLIAQYDAHHTPIYIVYIHPTERDVIERTNRVKILHEIPGWLDAIIYRLV